MNPIKYLASLTSLVLFSLTIAAQETDPKKTEVWTPIPKIISVENDIPSDAIVLFDGQNLNHWRKPKEKEGEPQQPAAWKVENDYFEVVPGTGGIETKKSFGDIQLHLEWNPPVVEGKEGQAYSNSGLFLMGRYELQILNSHENQTYSNGMAGSFYKQHIPLVNPANPPGRWQTYDVIFTAPRFGPNGSLISPAYATVLFNGVLVQNHVKLKGSTVFIGKATYIAHDKKQPIFLQDHGDQVRFRNVWVREL